MLILKAGEPGLRVLISLSVGALVLACGPLWPHTMDRGVISVVSFLRTLIRVRTQIPSSGNTLTTLLPSKSAISKYHCIGFDISILGGHRHSVRSMRVYLINCRRKTLQFIRFPEVWTILPSFLCFFFFFAAFFWINSVFCKDLVLLLYLLTSFSVCVYMWLLLNL